MAGENSLITSFKNSQNTNNGLVLEKERTVENHRYQCGACREDLFKIIAEFSTDWIYWINPDLTIGFVSTACKYITGFEAEEMRVNPDFLKEITHPDDNEKYNKLCESVSQGISFYTDEFRIITKTGEINWIYLVSQSVYDDDDNFLGRYVCVRDITGVKNAFKDTGHNEKLVLQIYDEASVGYYQIYFDGTLKGANKIFLNMLGYNSKDDFNGINFEQYCVLDTKKREKFKEAILGQGREKDFESEWLKRDGSVIYLLETGRAVTSGTYSRPYYEGVVHDLTAGKIAEQAVIEAADERRKTEKLKSELLATISHEIRTPLNVLINFTRMIKNEFATIPKKELSDGFNIIEREVKRIDRTLNLIVEMSQLQSGTYDFNISEINLIDDVFIPIYDEYYDIAAEKGMEFVLTNESADNTIYADRHSVMQIFTQLVDNAFKYTKSGKVEMILHAAQPKQIIAEVIDTGMGITKEYIPHLFSMFSQEDNSYSRMFEGTGLGLAVVKKYCEINDAEIEVESGKEQGTRFILTFKK